MNDKKITAEEQLKDQIELNKALKAKALSDRDGDKSNMYQYAVQELQSFYHHILQPLTQQNAALQSEVERLKDVLKSARTEFKSIISIGVIVDDVRKEIDKINEALNK